MLKGKHDHLLSQKTPHRSREFLKGDIYSAAAVFGASFAFGVFFAPAVGVFFAFTSRSRADFPSSPRT